MKALVTGAAAGLGRALTLHLSGAGHKVLAIDRDKKGLDALGLQYPSIQSSVCDLAETGSLPDVIEEWTSSGPFDCVVLNAGISATGRFERIPPQAHERVLAVNAVAPLIIASTLARLNALSLNARLIFVSSLSHRTGYPGAASYAASKDAIAVYAKSITRPFARRGIHVMRVFPGPIRTDHAERHAPAGARADRRMTPEELANRILKAAANRKRVVYPGAAARLTSVAGVLAPDALTAFMRRQLFEKLNREVW